MTPLREIRTIHACPKVGDTSTKTLTKSNTFKVGAEDVVSIELDGAIVIVRGSKITTGVPVAACQWLEFLDEPPVVAPQSAITVSYAKPAAKVKKQ